MSENIEERIIEETEVAEITEETDVIFEEQIGEETVSEVQMEEEIEQEAQIEEEEKLDGRDNHLAGLDDDLGASIITEDAEEAEDAAEDADSKVAVVGVRFRTAGKIYYFAPGEYEIKRGMHVIVETARGVEYGTVVGDTMFVEQRKIKAPLKQIIRIALPEDDAVEKANRVKEKEAYRLCFEKIRKHNLDMKLIDAEYTFDNNKILFYFTSDGRVDFRDLVKDLAGVFHTRIELRQIGVRDETKILGGYGICGRPLCCHIYLSDFAPVSIKMAKEQNLSLNPTKISGVCGRLMCCLKNEEDTYEELNRSLPKPGDEVEGSDGLHGEVESVNILRQRVRIIVEINDEKELHEYPADEITIVRKRRRGEAKHRIKPGEAKQPGGSSRTAKGERPEKADRQDRPERTEKAERQDRPERTERAERQDRPERTERAERQDRPERTERAERQDRPEHTERAENQDRPERPERRDTAEQKTADNVQSRKAGRNDRQGRPDRRNRQPRQERKNDRENGENGQPVKSERPARPERQGGKSDQDAAGLRKNTQKAPRQQNAQQGENAETAGNDDNHQNRRGGQFRRDKRRKGKFHHDGQSSGEASSKRED